MLSERAGWLSRRALLVLGSGLAGCSGASAASAASASLPSRVRALPLEFGAATPEPTAPVWIPPVPLPEPSPQRRVNIVLSPHPDDETLSLGVWTANALSRGERVIVVCLTDGRSTAAVDTLSTRLRRPFSRDEVASARITEMRSAVTALGVAPQDIYLAHLDRDATAGGSRVTQAEAYAVIQAFAERFPSATYATMSYTAERHPDHLGAGRALWTAMNDGIVRSGVFAVSRLWWHLPSPPVTMIQPRTMTVRERVLSAGRDYGVWDPGRDRYAVGWTSVHQQFADLMLDPLDHIHPFRQGSIQ